MVARALDLQTLLPAISLHRHPRHHRRRFDFAMDAAQRDAGSNFRAAELAARAILFSRIESGRAAARGADRLEGALADRNNPADVRVVHHRLAAAAKAAERHRTALPKTFQLGDILARAGAVFFTLRRRHQKKTTRLCPL